MKRIEHNIKPGDYFRIKSYWKWRKRKRTFPKIIVVKELVNCQSHVPCSEGKEARICYSGQMGIRDMYGEEWCISYDGPHGEKWRLIKIKQKENKDGQHNGRT